MTTFSKILVAAAAAATLCATVNSAFAHGHGGYRPSYRSYHSSYGSYQPYYNSYQPSYDSYRPSYDYNAYDDFGDYGYGSSYAWDHHGGYGHFSGGHDRRR